MRAAEASPLRGSDRWGRELELGSRPHRSLDCPRKQRCDAFVFPKRRPFKWVSDQGRKTEPKT